MTPKTANEGLHIAAFAGITRALTDAGATYLADGSWFRDSRFWSRPFWRGNIVVPCSSDAILRALAALAAIGYEPPVPLDPALLADPRSPTDAGGNRTGGGSSVDLVKLVNKERTAASITLRIKPTDSFDRDYYMSRVEWLSPVLAVHLPQIKASEFIAHQAAEDRCLQAVYDVAVQEELWRLWTESDAPPFPRPPLPGLLSVFSGPPPDDEPDDIQPDELPSFPLFDAMVKALNAAGATYLAEGLWHLERFDWGPPVWDGFVLVPCDEDVVRRLLAGFATIGYVPRSPVDPQIYADPGNLPDDDAAGDDFLRKDGDDPGDIVFQPEKRDLSRGLFEVLVQPPEKFHLEATGAGEEQCAPGVSVRIPDTALTDGRVASWRCPQRIRDVALLSTIWMRELVPEGCRAVDTPEIVSTYESRLSPQPETGVSLPRFTRITSALSNAGVRYTIIGHWNFDQRDDPPLYWTGHLELPLRPRDVNDAFAALAAVGYAPRVDVSAQAFLEGPRHDYWSAARGMSRSREQVLTFVDPSPGWARLLVVGLEWPDFCDNHDRASLEEVAPGVLAPVLNFELVVGTAARDCPQRLADVAALDAGWRKAADDEAAGGSLVPTRGRKGVPHPSYPVPERELGPGLSLELYEQVARALHAADARYVLNGSWLVWVESEAAVIWIGDLVVPRRVAAAATAFTSLASLGYAPEPPMSAQEFACWEPAPRWVDLMAGRDTLPRLRFVNAEHPAFAIRVTAIESSRFERLEAIARIEEAGRGVPVITRNLMSDGLVQSWCPQCIAEVRRLRDAMDAGLRQVLLEKWLALCGEAEDTADET